MRTKFHIKIEWYQILREKINLKSI
jgi:hypothetical protein